MKQTAVEWLAKELYEKFEMKGDGKVFDELLEQAKEMEKEIIRTAYLDGIDDDYTTSEQYYNETFKSE